MKLFGTDGIRGRANQPPMTVELALRLGQALGARLGQDELPAKVLVGRDTRLSGPMFEAALTAGLASAGVEVLHSPPLPTPAIAHQTHQLGCGAGIMLTASHNPAEDNGIKIFGADGYKLSDQLEEELEACLLDHERHLPCSEALGIGRSTPVSGLADGYLQFIHEAAGRPDLGGLTLVVDAGNGAASAIAARAFESLGATVVATACEPDGCNINEGCGALHPEHAALLVREHGAALGISLDGDADRVMFCDESGSPVSGDRVLALLALGLHRRGALRGRAMACTVMSNLGLHEAMKREGIEVLTTAVGDRKVLEALRERGASFGGENSGHILFTDHATTGDGLLGALMVLSMMKEQDAPLSRLAAVMNEFPQRLVNLSVPEKPPLEALESLQRELAEADCEFGDSGRHLIRYSGTENKIRILVEHRDQHEVDRWVDRFVKAVETDLAVAT